MTDAVTPRMITFATEYELHDHAEKLNQAGLHPDVAIMDSRGIAVLACRTAPGGDDWGFEYYSPGEDGFMECIHSECTDCGGPRPPAVPGDGDWKPAFPAYGLVGYDLTGIAGLG